MRNKSGKHDLQRELHNLVDVVAPRVESAVNTVAEKTPPLIDRGRDVAGTVADRGRIMAIEKGTLLAERLPDNVVDRLPDTVSDRLPGRSKGRGKKLLFLGIIGVAIAFVARKAGMLGGSKSTVTQQASTPSKPPVSTAGPTSVSTETPSETDPTDPLAEPRVNGRMN